jgi:hypothetical protein
MRARYLTSLVSLTFILAACSGQQVSEPRMPEKGNPEYFKVRDSMADEVYVNEDVAKSDWVDGVRRIYLAPANTSRTQIIQPRGVSASDIDAWEMTAEEESVLQNKFFRAMRDGLEVDDAFTVVSDRSKAQAILYSRVIAVHPYQPRSVVEAGGKGGGAVTMNFAIVDPADDKVMIRLLDSKSTKDIWSFHQMENDKSALDLIFSAWGNQIRRSVLFLQGRLNEPLEPAAIQLKRQK